MVSSNASKTDDRESSPASANARGGIPGPDEQRAQGGAAADVAAVTVDVKDLGGLSHHGTKEGSSQGSLRSGAEASNGGPELPKSSRPVWTGHGPDPFASDDEDYDAMGDMPSLGACQTMNSRVVGAEKFGSQPLTSYVVIVCLVAACGGLLFGYSLAITAGLQAMDSFVQKFFSSANDEGNAASAANEDALAEGAQRGVEYCPDANLQGYGFYTASLFLAGALASPVTFFTSNYLGRRGSILIAGATYLSGGILQMAAVSVSMLYLGRILTGVAVSFANQSVPVFLSEMAPPRLRGALSMGFQFAVTIGILGSQLLTYWMNMLSAESGWRYALALSNVPAFIVLLGGLFLPDTPNSLIARGKPEEGRRVLERIRGTSDVAMEFMDIQEAVETVVLSQGPGAKVEAPKSTSATVQGAIQNCKAILQRDHRPQLTISVVVPIIQQLTGANAVLFYAPLLFESAGSSTEAALLSNVIIGCTNVAATGIAVVAVDRLGRRGLLIEGLVQMMLAMVVMAAALALAPEEMGLSGSLPSILLAMILVFFTGYAWSWAGLAWVIPNEVQPIDSRSSGQAVAVFCNFMATFVVGQFFPTMLCALEWRVYIFFSAFCLLGIAFTMAFIPETKGLGIEDVYFLFTKHWFWKRFFTEEQQAVVVLDARASDSLQVPGLKASVMLSRQITSMSWIPRIDDPPGPGSLPNGRRSIS